MQVLFNGKSQSTVLSAALILIVISNGEAATPISAARQISLALEQPPDTPPPVHPEFPFDARTAAEYQQAFASWAGLPAKLKNAQGLEFVLIPPGEFLMGSPEDEPGHGDSAYDESRHPVRLTRPFYLSRFEVTVRQFAQFVEATGMLTDGEKNGGGNTHDSRANWKHRAGTSWRQPGFAGPFELSDAQPVVHVSHFDARRFCEWLADNDPGPRSLPRLRYSLPTEAQWEWACRAGAGTRYWWGSDPDDTGSQLNVGDERLKQVQPKWPRETIPMNDGFAFPAPVGSYDANAFGLHDMLGNVWEFCATHYGPFPKTLSIDPGDLDLKRGFAVRGGGWSNTPNDARCATRNADPPHFCHSNLGFRVGIQLPTIRILQTNDTSHHLVLSGEIPNDTRLGPLRTERAEFTFTPPESVEDWQERKEEVRRTMLVSMGLWPLPEKTPLNAVVHGAIDCGEYTVEKIYLESVPGFYVTGNLYRPKNATGRRPAVLTPHGHFPGGRFQDAGLDAVRQSIAAGAERFEDGGRSFMQSRCVQLARMGCVVFHYDMIGYGDSQQLSLDLVHRFSRSRVKFDTPPEHGFYSAQAENWLINPLGLHTWNSIRALDFLTGLPDVDPDRIAVTGGSGGGTQTFMLCAVDDRPLVSVPVVIVSTARQGGCTCENVSHLHLDTFNLEMNALHAPKPLLLISADDATRTMGRRGFPELQRHYELLGKDANVAHEAFLHFPHNYNAVSRMAMYRFVNRHLKLGLSEPIIEHPYRLLTRDDLTVWNADHARPETDPDFELRFVNQWIETARGQVQKLIPTDLQSYDQFRDVVGNAWEVLLPGLPGNADVSFQTVSSAERNGYRETAGLVRYRNSEGHHAELPVIRLDPQQARRGTAVWIRAAKRFLFARNGEPTQSVRQLLNSGRAVIGVDLFGQGEFHPQGSVHRQRALPGETGFAGWTYCYNLTMFARQVQDALAVIEWAGSQATRPVDLIGLSGVGHIAAGAAFQSGDRLARVAIQTDGGRWSSFNNVYGSDFLPGAARYLDLPGLISLARPESLWVGGEEESVDQGQGVRLIETVWNARGKPDGCTVVGQADGQTDDAIKWLLANDRSTATLPTPVGNAWPQWRGPRQDGTWHVSGLPDVWPADGLPRRWTQPVGGGYGGVAAANGCVFLMDRQTEPREVERIVCCDAATGRLEWVHEYPVAYGDLDYGSGPRATPTIHDGRVYTLGAIGHVFCLDAATGNVLWQREYPLDPEKKLPMWGLAASPIIDRGRVIIHVGAEPDGCLIALNCRTGAEVWRSLPDPSGYATPILIDRNGRREIVSWTPDNIHGLVAETGQVLWSVPYDVTYGVSIATPLYRDGIVFVSGYWEGARAVQLGEEPAQAELIWQDNTHLRGVMSSPLYRDGHVYMIDKSRGLTCFELATGRKVWDDGNSLTPRGRNPQASIVWINDTDRVIALNSDGELVLARLTPDGYDEQSRTRIIGPTWAHPAFAHGHVFARSDDELVCVRISSEVP